MYDKIANDADWKDGINAFRLQVMESLAIINHELEKIKTKLKQKENTP
jgi:hypothetical protein